MVILYPLLIVALFLSTVSADFTLNIDCGSLAGSTLDDNFVSWTGDDDTVISTGQPKSVSTTYSSSSFVLNTLRAFPTGKKNCYVLKGEVGAKVQLRVMFYYGNYDGKSAPPTFGLQFDGNDWATVETTMAYLYYDVIYVTKGDNINVCLIQTNPNQTPFISAIEVQILKPAMYDLADTGKALFLVNRLTLSTESISYSTDIYDRIWTPMSLSASSQFRRLVYDDFLIDVSTSPEEPPVEVLKNALSLTTSNTSDETLKWTIPDLPSTPISVYLKLYFSEMTGLASTQKRAFGVYIGDTLKNSSLIPPYGSVAELTFTDITMSNATFISLVPTTDSTEPPLVNSMEVFRVSDYKVSYTSVQLSSKSPPDSSSGDAPPTSFSTGSSSGKKKSKLPVIFGAGIPVSVLITAFLVVVGLMRQKRKKAAAGNNGHNQSHMMNDAAESGQGVAMNEFTVNVEDSNNGDAYPSPAPLLFNLNN